MNKVKPTGQETPFTEKDGFIVSKTDLKGTITYVNRAFMRIADYPPYELIGQPHNIIRHPDMPRTAFKMLWDNLKNGEEWFGFVKNLTKNGNHYWGFANVTIDENNGQLVGYYSVLRPIIHRDSLRVIERVYGELRQLEQQSLEKAEQHLQALLKKEQLSYRDWVFKLYQEGV